MEKLNGRELHYIYSLVRTVENAYVADLHTRPDDYVAHFKHCQSVHDEFRSLANKLEKIVEGEEWHSALEEEEKW